MTNAYLVDLSGQIARMQVNNRQHLRELKRKGYRLATPAERVDHLKQEKEKALQHVADAKLLDVFFIAPRKNRQDGYGVTQKQLKKYCQEHGVFLNDIFTGQKVGLCYNYPYAVASMKTEYKIIFTMFESTKMPKDWGEYLEMADLVIVPSKFCARIMKSQFGINAKVINLGYDAENFQYIEREKGDKFTFLHYDAFKWRKGWDLVLQAYDEEFKEEEDVALIMKTTQEQSIPLGEYKNAEKITGSIPHEEFKEILERSDCFVFPSRGEGFGITPLEAMATGMPVIVPNAHGISEYFDWELMEDLEVFPIKASYDNPKFDGMDLGEMFQPTLESLRKAMRKAYGAWKQNEIRKPYYERLAEYAKEWTIQKTAKDLSDELKLAHKKTNTNRKNKIVFLTEDTRHITGGRYYSWWLATALKACGCDVEIYTDRMPVFIKEFRDYPQPTVYIVDSIREVNVKATWYFGSPVQGSIRACQLAEKYGKEAFVEIFDPFPMMEKYKGQNKYLDWGELLRMIKKENIKIVSLCKETNKYIYPWLNKRLSQVFTVNPCINSIEKEKAEVTGKKDWAVFVSRLDHHKNLDHVLEAVKETDLELHVITSIDGVNFDEMVKEYDMEKRVKIHWFASDKEKFEIIKQSKVMINGATFEGYGMWLAEALSCGVPCVCYDYPTFKEIAGEQNPLVYYSKWNDKEDLKNKFKEASKREAPEGLNSNKYDFERMIERFQDIMYRPPRIGVVTICLNEEDYIKPSILSTLKHPNIAKIAVVEGCVEQNEHSENKNGLSADNTEKAVREAIEYDEEGKIIYDRYGWASSKSELRNRALQLLGNDVDYILVVDGDEVWKHTDLNKLVTTIKKNPDASVLRFKLLHFWKQPNYRAVGGQWDAPLFRFFKYADKSFHWERHEAEVVNKNGYFVGQVGDVIDLKDEVFVYHYGYLKPEIRVKEKLEYYKKRDTNLKVKNTFSNWEKGKPTQPTHGGGDVEEFQGEHPKIVRQTIIKLCNHE